MAMVGVGVVMVMVGTMVRVVTFGSTACNDINCHAGLVMFMRVVAMIFNRSSDTLQCQRSEDKRYEETFAEHY